MHPIPEISVSHLHRYVKKVVSGANTSSGNISPRCGEDSVDHGVLFILRGLNKYIPWEKSGTKSIMRQ